MTNLQKIREACIKANPVDMGERGSCIKCEERLCFCPERWDLRLPDGNIMNWHEDTPRPIRLADILMVLENKDIGIVGDTFIKITYQDWKTFNIEWNLEDDNLENQSKETIDFIVGLIN